MRCLIILTIFLGLALASPSRIRGYPNIKEFEEEFGKTYTPEDEIEAEKNLLENEAQIEANNKLYDEGKSNFREAVMEWDDLSPEEFLREKTGALDGKENFGLLIEDRYNSNEMQKQLDEFYASVTVPNEVINRGFDARVYGIVTSIKNQGSCGSCSAFAATSQHETCFLDAGLQRYRKEMDLSEQHLLECAYDGIDALGCKGAYIKAYPRFLYEKYAGFVHHENNYPYLMDRRQKCEADEQNIPRWAAGARITGALYDDYADEEKLMKMVYKFGSAVTVVYASDYGFKNYKAGTVFDTCDSSQAVNHAVAVIGWGTQNGQDYWIIKNSWGEDYGDQGYIHIKRGTCGIGSRTAVAMCERYGNIAEVPKATGYLTATPCDVSKKFGEVTGETQLYYVHPDGTKVHTNVKCAHSQCTTRDPHTETNTCMVLCGRPTCERQ